MRQELTPDYLARYCTIRKVLVANRGDAARRVIRTCRRMGLGSAAAVSDVDARSSAVRDADDVVVLGGARAADSYLRGDLVIEAALRLGCDAVHPGYGFLSESAAFAEAVASAGLTFVGPAPSVVRLLGDKASARAAAAACGIPVTPGSRPGLDDESLAAAAASVGFPVMVKATAGGGGRGMRVVSDPAGLAGSVAAAREEARRFFGDGDVYLERFVPRPRHVEVQVIGDSHGAVLHLGTRDCSSQRRYQKVIEEAPAPYLPDHVRSAVEQGAVEVCRRAGYTNVGTVEFIVSGDDYYFLEVNTRLQVEHPVTEEVTGVDLVALQLVVASGAALPFSQEDVVPKGHAVEFRVYAEDPARGFSPTVGTVTSVERPTGVHSYREDLASDVGDVVSTDYDGLLSKLIVRGRDRASAILASDDVLASYDVRGVRTNRDLLRWMVRLGDFRGAPVDVGYIDRAWGDAAAASLAAAALEASDLRDPSHRPPVGGTELVETFRVPLGDGTHAFVKVVHTAGGHFLASRDEPRPDPGETRMSNGREAAVRAVVAEVIRPGSGPTSGAIC